MDQLRWILLGVGVLFLLGLAWWEFRRPRHAASNEESGDPPESQAWRAEPAINSVDSAAIEIPEMRSSDHRGDPPLLMLDEMRAGHEEMDVNVAMEVAVDRPGAANAASEFGAMAAAQPEPAAEAFAVTPPQEVPIIWPPARQEKIIWLRVVPGAQGSLNGRLLRIALTGCGMVHGPQDIFHWVDDAGQVLASAANLVRPGNFDLHTMDTQQYQGVHLFSVLPGPLAPVQTFNELLGLARDLAARVTGLVQDERGNPVDAARVAEIRASLQGLKLSDPDGEGGEAGA